MLVGNPPFEKAHRDDVRYAMIADGRLREMLDILKLSHRMTDGAVDIIECMVCEPQHRLTVQELWNHPWMRLSLGAVDAAGYVDSPHHRANGQAAAVDGNTRARSRVPQRQATVRHGHASQSGQSAAEGRSISG